MTHNEFVTRVVVCTLAVIVVSVVAVLLIGLFDPAVDNDKIFAIIGPAFYTVVGAFVGVLTGKHLADKERGP